MHDISLGHTIEDYLTGEAVEATTYEDLRQALAKMLVEERGWPSDRLRPRHPVRAVIDGNEYTRLVDIAGFDTDDSPLLLVLFAPGEVTTYERESLAAARLVESGPAPLVAVTDSKDAVLLSTRTGERLEQGMRALPSPDRARELAAAHPVEPIDGERRCRESRILYAYSESLYDCCGGAACAAEGRGARFGEDAGKDTDNGAT
ncbi:MAG: type I restriction enzyme HsdR N-terminal domain-containing protein [Oceanidesulfovibrio sp.]